MQLNYWTFLGLLHEVLRFDAPPLGSFAFAGSYSWQCPWAWTCSVTQKETEL